jgi:hypothetical protein
LGTLIVTNGFLRTSAYVIISISFAARPKKIAIYLDAKPNHISSITSARPWQPLSRSGFITARRPPDQMRQNLRMANLIPQTTSYSNFIVVAALFVRRDHGQFRPTNLEMDALPLHSPPLRRFIITRGLLRNNAPTSENIKSKFSKLNAARNVQHSRQAYQRQYLRIRQTHMHGEFRNYNTTIILSWLRLHSLTADNMWRTAIISVVLMHQL